MRIGLWFCAGGAVFLLAAPLCHAGITAQGTNEIMGSFGWNRYSVWDDQSGEASLSLFQFSPTYGYFFAENLEFQARLTIAGLHVDGEVGSYGADLSATIWSPTGIVLGHAAISETYVPYFGVGLGGSWYSDSEGSETDATLVLPIVVLGAKMLVTQSAAVNIEFYYTHHENAVYSEELHANEFGLAIGLSLFLGSRAAPEEREERWHPLDW